MKSNIIGICIAAMSFIVPARAPAQPLLAAVPQYDIVQVGEVFGVDITVDAALLSLMGYDVTVSFDATIVELIGVAEGPLPQSTAAPTFFYWWQPGGVADTVAVNGAVLGTTVDGPGILYTIAFKGIDVGETPITITISELRTGTNAPITHDTQSASVIVDKQIPVEAVSWGVIKSLYY